jgi:hypothetical protein
VSLKVCPCHTISHNRWKSYFIMVFVRFGIPATNYFIEFAIFLD